MEVSARGVVASEEENGAVRRLEVPEIVAHLQPWRPHHVIAVGHGPFRFHQQEPGRNFSADIDAEKALSSLIFDNKGALERLAVDINNAKVMVDDDRGGSSFDVARAQFHSRLLPDDSNATEAAVKLERVVFADMEDNPLGNTLDTIDATVIQYGTLEPPLDGAKIDAWRAEGGKVALERLHLVWGAVRVDGEGDVGVDEQRRPSGGFRFSVVGHDAVLDAMVENGVIKDKERTLALALLTPLTRIDDSGNRRLEIPLVIKHGMLSLGGMPIRQLEPIL